MIIVVPNFSYQRNSSARPIVVEKISRLIAVLMLSVLFPFPLLGQPTTTAQENASAKIVWTKQRDVGRYRLQVATDVQFQDVLFDRLVDGDENGT